MSGQPYRYATDVDKFRNEYLQALGLQADINQMNLEANKTYKETGQLPPVSQMKDTRTTAEILADTERLKIDVIGKLKPLGDIQFAQAVVQGIMNSPFNANGSLFSFFAQRATEIVEHLRKSYAYGIKGDQNDVERFISFVVDMFTKSKNQTSTVREYFNKPNVDPKIFGASGAYDLAKLAEHLRILADRLIGAKHARHRIGKAGIKPEIATILHSTASAFNATAEFLDKSKFSEYRKEYLELIDKIDVTRSEYDFIVNYDATMDLLQKIPSSSQIDYIIGQIEQAVTNSNPELLEKNVQHFISVLGPLNDPSVVPAGEELLMSYIDALNEVFANIKKEEHNTELRYNIEELRKEYEGEGEEEEGQENEEGREEEGQEKEEGEEEEGQENIDLMTIEQIKKLIKTKERRIVEIEDDEDYTRREKLNYQEPIRRELKDLKIKLAEKYRQQREGEHDEEPMPQPEPQHNEDEAEIDYLKQYIKDIGVFRSDHTQEIKNLEIARERAKDPNEKNHINDVIERYKSEMDEAAQKSKEALQRLRVLQSKAKVGHGLPKRRGRPKGSGIAKPYNHSVVQHAAFDKGIESSPRFVKFGNYLVNLRKLHNEDILALKTGKGFSVQNLPSKRLSKNLSGIIKKMIGGSVLSYAEINSLSEPEKIYLHNVAKKANIQDKFTIPAPSMEKRDKDIHDFEVMKGEIMAGNDNKDLIKKFKIHILRLSKEGVLPKKEVAEIMEDLLELGI